MLKTVYVLYRGDEFVNSYRTEGHAKNGRSQRNRYYVYDPETRKGHYEVDESYHIVKYDLRIEHETEDTHGMQLHTMQKGQGQVDSENVSQNDATVL